MKTLKKSNLEELAKIMPVLSEGIQRMCIGGLAGDSGDIPPGSGDTGAAFNPPPSTLGPLGSINNPYSMGEAEALMNAGHWGGGFVEGMGYMLPQLESTAPSGNKPPIPGFPNFGIQSPGTSGVTGYNPGDSGYTNSNGYGGPTGSFIGTGGGSGGSGGSGSGGGGGSSSNEYYGPHMTGSTCLPDNEKPNLYYNDTMSALTGVAPGATNKEIWEQTKYFYLREARERGYDLTGVMVGYLDENSVYASVTKAANGQKNLNVGNNFFLLEVSDRISVFVHEAVHAKEDKDVNGYIKMNVSINVAQDMPENMKKYLVNRYFDGVYDEKQFLDYCNYNHIKDPQYYRNELNAYTKEIELCPNVSKEYAQDREFRLWLYGELLNKAEKYY